MRKSAAFPDLDRRGGIGRLLDRKGFRRPGRQELLAAADAPQLHRADVPELLVDDE